MISAASNQVFQKEWFDYVPAGDSGLYGVPKTEYQDLFNQTVKALEEQSKKNYESLTERVRASGSEVKLTEEQKQYLTESFNPKNMSRSEYQEFIDKLCEFGVLDEADKPYVSYGQAGSDLELIPLSVVNGRAYLMAANGYNPKGYTNSFSSSRGNALNWASYLASIQVWDRGSFRLKPEAVLFGRIKDVLEEIAGR